MSNILVVGGGGREHAIAWSLSLSSKVNHVYVAPGNGGTATMGSKVSNVSISENKHDELIDFAKKNVFLFFLINSTRIVVLLLLVLKLHYAMDLQIK